MTSKPYTMWLNKEKLPNNSTVTHSQCVEKCPEGYDVIVNRCIKKNKVGSVALANEFDSDSSGDTISFAVLFDKSWKPVVVSIIAAFCFSIIVLILFRHAIRQIIWGFHIGVIIVLFAVSVALFVAATRAVNSTDQQQKSSSTMLFVFAGIFALAAVVDALMLYWFRRKIEVVINIFKETSRALIDLVQLLFEPILTFFWLVITSIGFTAFYVTIKCAGELQVAEGRNGTYAVYSATNLQTATHVINWFVFYWFVNFIVGCQHYIIASTISQWFFTRDKTTLKGPVTRAFSHLLNFHVGTICLGSLFITIASMIAAFIRALTVS